jgi:hypothetical protein
MRIHLMYPNALALSPTTTQLTFISRQQTTQLAHTKPSNIQLTIEHTQFPVSFNITSPPSLHHTMKKKIRQPKGIKAHQNFS